MAAAEPWVLERGGAGWPPGLEDLDRLVEFARAPRREGAPLRLYGLGDRDLLSGLDPLAAVTLVGARRSTAAGRSVASELAAGLSAAGLTVVSGMAFGIDSAAHEGALLAGGPTIAVLAGGPDVPYPPSALALHRRIVEQGGAVVSEISPGQAPARWGFPARNRIMAALSAATLLVEARDPSGSRITADKALALDRIVGAVPGSVRAPLSAGPHSLIKDGAHLIEGPQDVLDLLFGVGVREARRLGPPLDGSLAAVLACVGAEPAGGEAIASAVELPASGVAVGLARLELLGYLRSELSGFARTGLEPP